MTYTIGDRKVSLENMSEADRQLVVSHSKTFKYCLNNAVHKLLLKVKNIVHLYSDVMTIYSTLLRKIPDYDDVTLMANKVKLHTMKLEQDYNGIFGEITSSHSSDRPTGRRRGASIVGQHGELSGSRNPSRHWEDLNYETAVKPFSVLLLKTTIESFEEIAKTLNCIEIFFNNFSNLKKLLIPLLTKQTSAIIASLNKANYLLSFITIVDDIPRELDGAIVKQLKKIEKITNGLERESFILDTAFKTFDPSLSQYTRILLGKAILKRDIALGECSIIKRRDVCFHAAEFVGSIPLSEVQPFKRHINAISYAVLVVMALISLVVWRLCRIFFGA